MLRNTRSCNEKCSKKKRFCFEKSSFRIRTWSFLFTIVNYASHVTCYSRTIDWYFILTANYLSKEKKKHIEHVYIRSFTRVKFSTITRACLLGRNEELFELYPHRGSSNSIDNWPRSKTFLLKLRREKQINPFQRFVKRQERARWHDYRGGIEPSPIPISYLRGMNFTTRSV